MIRVVCCNQGFHRNSGLRFTYGNDPEIFSISIMEKVPEIRNSGTISGTIFFPVNRKFPERCSGIPDRYGIPERSGNFRNVLENRSGNFPEKSFRKFSGKIVPEISGTIGTRITLKPFSLRLTYVSTTQHAVSKTNNIWQKKLYSIFKVTIL